MAELSASPASAERIHFAWLVRLRWVSIVGQVVTIALSGELLGVTLPLVGLGLVILAEVALNVAVWVWLRRAERVTASHIAAVIAADLLLFTGLLYLSGGPSNPFSFLYLVHLALAALMLPSRLGWALVGLSLLCSAALFADHVPLATGHEHHAHAQHGSDAFDWHLRGMWVALGVAASFIVYFLRRVAQELAVRERQLSDARDVILRGERLASLATLAAGAAHELGTPLGTIAVAARELERSLADRHADATLLEDAQLIRAQVDRCRHILDELAANAGQPVGGAPEPVELAQIVAEILPRAPGLEVTLPSPRPRLRVPRVPVTKALQSLVNNAVLAAGQSGHVRLSAALLDGHFVLAVEDDGPGMTPEVLEHATEPFFSTRAPGSGMGLGLFLARSVAEQLGGRLELDSRLGRGTRAALILPASVCDDLSHPGAADAA